MKNYLDFEQLKTLFDAGYKYLGLQEHMRTRDRYEYLQLGTHVYQFKNGSDTPVWMCSESAWQKAIHRVCNAELAHEVISPDVSEVL